MVSLFDAPGPRKDWDVDRVFCVDAVVVDLMRALADPDCGEHPPPLLARNRERHQLRPGPPWQI